MYVLVLLCKDPPSSPTKLLSPAAFIRAIAVLRQMVGIFVGHQRSLQQMQEE